MHTIVLWANANSENPDQTAPKGAVWSGFKLFAIQSHPFTHSDTSSHLRLATRKPVFGVSDKARLKPVSSATETS